MALATYLPRVLLAGIYCSDFSADQAAACVRLYNPGPDAADLSGLVLEWGGVPLLLPGGKALPAEGSLYVAWNADAYLRLFTRLPDYSVTAAADVPTLAAPQGAPRALQPGGGAIRLLTQAGDVLDAFVWGDGPRVKGWLGPAMPPVEQGTLFRRAIAEESLGPASAGRFVTDPGTAAAWRQGTDWLPRRLPRAGQSELTYPTLTVPGVLAFTCPDSAYGVISQFIDRATQTLDINLYLFTQAGLADRVIAAVGRKVAVRLLAEGEPYLGMPPNDRENIARLQAGGVAVRVLHQTPDGFRRYRFDHAKYAVADGHRCLVMSDNWTNHSVPDSTVTGHRGWGVIMDSAALAAHLTGIFAADWNAHSRDSVPFDPSTPHVIRTAPPLAAVPQAPLRDPIAPVQIAGPLPVTPFFAPDHALLRTRAICGLIRSAAGTLDVQQASIHLFWGAGKNGSVDATPSLFLAEIAAAARRGVQVRVLMDGAYLHRQDPRDNLNVRDWLQALADREKLALEARILDGGATGMSIHNKGLISDGQKVLISSINWSENSPLENREMGLILESPAVAAFFGRAFNRDWAGGK